MARYFFDLYDSATGAVGSGDREGVELASSDTAKHEAVATLMAHAKDIFGSYDSRALRFVVRSEEGYVCEVEIAITVRDLA